MRRSPRCHVLAAAPTAYIPEIALRSDGMPEFNRHWFSWYPSHQLHDAGRWLDVNEGASEDNRIAEMVADVPDDHWLSVVDYYGMRY